MPRPKNQQTPPGGIPPQVQGMQFLPFLRGWRMYRKLGLLELARKKCMDPQTPVSCEGEKCSTA